MSEGTKTDNSMEEEKAALRIKFLPQDAKVLDLFCGKGSMYKLAYKDRVKDYLGIDREKVHSKNICYLMDNEKYIRDSKISKYNVFDLDAYGSPWKLLYLICNKLDKGFYTFYITDGLVLNQKLNGNVNNFVSATEGIPKGINIPGMNRFYVEVFLTMLKRLENKYNCKVNELYYFHNSRRTVYYWAIKIEVL